MASARVSRGNISLAVRQAELAAADAKKNMVYQAIFWAVAESEAGAE